MEVLLFALLVFPSLLSFQEIPCGAEEVNTESTYDEKYADTPYFTSEMKSYIKLHESILSGKVPEEDRKYVIFQPVHTGVGNRLEGLISSFLLAYLTDRAFIVDWDFIDPMSKLPRITQIEDEVLDAPFNWDANFFRRLYSVEEIKENSELHELRGGAKSMDIPVTDQVCCGDLEDYFSNKFVFIKGNKYFAQLLTANTHYEDQLKMLFGYGTHRNMMAPLLGFLIKPKKEIVDDVSEFVDRFKGKTLVGIHIRTAEKFAEAQNLPIYHQCAELNSETDNTVYFVATDDMSVRKSVVKYFGEDNVVFHDVDIDMSHRQARYRTTATHAIKDMLTLARCDEMVITCGSAFSRVAAGIARKPPVVASAGGSHCQKHLAKTCMKSIGIESCAFHWFENNLKKCSCYNTAIGYRENAICGSNM